MSFPFTFAERSGDYDFNSPIINFTGNAAVVAVGGIVLGVLASVALKALGFSQAATSIATAVPVAFGALAGVGAILGIAATGYMMYSVMQALGRR